ncbi:MAG TPA: VOC family protein [Thermomicrobiales bacterium]|nr:VOC family protein [Thermomicrobiales bacterium]
MRSLSPNLWFNDNAEEAANFYLRVFPESELVSTGHYTEVGPGKDGAVVTKTLRIGGVDVTLINGGMDVEYTWAMSLLIPCENQDEVDYFWAKLTDGGQELQCGWLKDRYGVPWQVVPVQLEAMMLDPDREKVNRMMAVMLQQVNLIYRPLSAHSTAISDAAWAAFPERHHHAARVVG